VLQKCVKHSLRSAPPERRGGCGHAAQTPEVLLSHHRDYSAGSHEHYSPMRQFSQVDVFATGAVSGNPVAVVHDAEGLSDSQMRAFAKWTNLSETTFLFQPTQPEADYRVRIFTPEKELPFAGHPTLGTAHAWEERGGTPKKDGEVLQECGIGLVSLKRVHGKLAFRAPELLRSGPVDDETLHLVYTALKVPPETVQHANWIDNGPGWLGLVLQSADQVLSLRPNFAALGDLIVGVMGPYGDGGPADYEVRAFVPTMGAPEDPVTGSLNAGLAKWLIPAQLVPEAYTVRQGTALGRQGRVNIYTESDESIWIAGGNKTLVSGTVDI